MATTYEAIATVEVGAGGAASISFSSISQDFTDLAIKVSGRSSADNVSIDIALNGVTTNQTYRRLRGYNGTASSSTLTVLRALNGWLSATANTFGNSEIYIPNYTGSTYKSLSIDGVNENNSTEAYADLAAGLWSDTAAITSITLTPNAGNFVQYSTATLYGIKNS